MKYKVEEHRTYHDEKGKVIKEEYFEDTYEGWEITDKITFNKTFENSMTTINYSGNVITSCRLSHIAKGRGDHAGTLLRVYNIYAIEE